MLILRHTSNNELFLQKKPRFILIVASAVAATFALILVVLILPLDGKYSSRVLDSLPGDALLVLKDGNAFIRGPDGEMIPYGHYSRIQGQWKLQETGSTNDWWDIVRHFGGFDLVCPSNSVIRYRFTKRWLDWAYAVEGPPRN